MTPWNTAADALEELLFFNMVKRIREDMPRKVIDWCLTQAYASRSREEDYFFRLVMDATFIYFYL